MHVSLTSVEIHDGVKHIFRVLRTFEPEVEFVTQSRRRRKTRIGHITVLCSLEKETSKEFTLLT